MKIENGSNLTRAQLESIHPTEQLAKASTPQPAPVRDEAKDKAEFSERSLSLSKAKGALDVVPEVRTEKVSSLRDQIQTGAYQVPYEKLAGKLLDKLM
jgi:flagellar biosynthesis anti-sigma factor FlgM